MTTVEPQGCNATLVTMTFTVDMTGTQVGQWAADNGVEPSDVPGDVAAYVLHNVLDISDARRDYWRSVSLDFAGQAGSGLAWTSHVPGPGCDEVAIETAWGSWPYRILGYTGQVVVQKYMPDSGRHIRVVDRGERTFVEMMAEARSVAQEWDR